MKFREIYLEEKYIGIIGFDNGKAFAKADKPHFQSILKSLIIPVRVDFTGNENTVSMSLSKIIQSNNEEWLFYMQFNLPYNIFAGEIQDG